MYAAAEDKFDLKSLHELHHFGVDRTLYLAKVCNPDDARKEVESCIKCKSVDPSTVHWEKGNLDVELNWDRIACDVTHNQGNIHLTMIDCGPSRYAIWRKIANEKAPNIVTTFD